MKSEHHTQDHPLYLERKKEQTDLSFKQTYLRQHNGVSQASIKSANFVCFCCYENKTIKVTPAFTVYKAVNDHSVLQTMLASE